MLYCISIFYAEICAFGLVCLIVLLQVAGTPSTSSFHTRPSMPFCSDIISKKCTLRCFHSDLGAMASWLVFVRVVLPGHDNTVVCRAVDGVTSMNDIL